MTADSKGVGMDFSQLYDVIYKRAVWLCKSVDMAEDVTQETFLSYLEHNPPSIKNPMAWLITVLKHKVYDHWREKKKKKTTYYADYRDPVTQKLTVLDKLVMIEEWAEIYRQLSPEQYTALHFQRCGRPLRVVSEELGIPRRTLFYWLRGGRDTINSVLGKNLCGMRSHCGANS